jgi:hypothetical protein
MVFYQETGPTVDDGNGKPGKTGTARYSYDGKRYKLAAGDNPLQGDDGQSK